jgi:hypothetical protein
LSLANCSSYSPEVLLVQSRENWGVSQEAGRGIQPRLRNRVKETEEETPKDMKMGGARNFKRREHCTQRPVKKSRPVITWYVFGLILQLK